MPGSETRSQSPLSTPASNSRKELEAAPRFSELFRGWSFAPQGARLGLTRRWSSRRCCWL